MPEPPTHPPSTTAVDGRRRRLRSTYLTAVEDMDERTVSWRSLAALYAFGGLLGLFSLLMPGEPGRSVPAVALIAATACACGLVLWRLAPRLPRRAMPLLLLNGTLLISAAVYFDGDSEGGYALYYVWVAMEAFFFFTKRQALLQIAGVGVAYALVLALQPTATPAFEWTMIMGTALITGSLVAVLRDRIEVLMARLADASRRDPLTDLLNRRGFLQAMDVELERARRARAPVTVLLADLDGLKAVNDDGGHAAGDQLLRRFARILDRTTRRIDVAARLGGDEFVVIAPSADSEAGYLLAERVRRAMGDEGLDGVTVSWGIATWPHHAGEADALVQAADQALYAAKGLGRDRCVIFSDHVTGELTAVEQRRGDRELVAPVVMLAEALDMRDAATASHSTTVGRYARTIAAELGLDAERVERIGLAGVVHDVGKIGIPDPILRKEGPLSPAEWDEMRRHPMIGARILSGAHLDDIGRWVLAHHERLDGRGYPFGLEGRQISLEARILAVADAYEAMTADRPYRAAMSREDARAELRRCAGTQFDAVVVEAFLSALSSDAPASAPGAVSPAG